MPTIRVTHCPRCGSTGRVFDDVPGSRINGVPMTMHQYAPKARACPGCDGSGHLIETIMEGAKQKEIPQQTSLNLLSSETETPTDETYHGAPHTVTAERARRGKVDITKGTKEKYLPMLIELLEKQDEAILGELPMLLKDLPVKSRFDIAWALVEAYPEKYRLIKPKRGDLRKLLIITTNMNSVDQTINRKEERK
jgi:hypothetical protein